MIRRLLAAVLVVAGCDKPPAEAVENATPSPNASILPAPLSSVGQPAAETPAARAAAALGQVVEGPDATTPATLRGDQAPDDDTLAARELPGVKIDAEWRWLDPAAPPKGPEVNLAAIESARRATAPRMKIELASVGRMRIAFASRALPLAAATEIRGRTDLYGHVLVWPNGSQYRVLPPGAVRTLLGERRIDAVPLVRPQSTTRGEGQRRLGLATKKWDLSTRSGKLSLEQAKIPNSGEGGALLCRLLSELVSIDPSAAPCATDEVPLRAQITWPGSGGGGVVLEAIAINEKVELATSTMLVPPPGGEFVPASLPPFPAAVFLSREELAALRLRPLELPARSVGAPDDGLLVFNGTDSLRYAFVDTVPVGWVAPGRELLVPGLVRGRYLVQWRTFLGDAVEAPSLVEVPARIAIGVASSVALDAGR